MFRIYVWRIYMSICKIVHLLDPEGYFVRKGNLHCHVGHLVNLHVHHHVNHLVNLHVHYPYQFCEVLVWSGRLEGFESITVNMQKCRTVNDQGRPRAARAANNYLISRS